MALFPSLFLKSVSCLIVLTGTFRKTSNYNKRKSRVGHGGLCCHVSDLTEMLLEFYYFIIVTSYCFLEIFKNTAKLKEFYSYQFHH